MQIKMLHFEIFLFCVWFLLRCPGMTLARIKIRLLGRMNLVNEPITISGYDSGGDMALQMHVAFSKNFRGAAMFASIWYNCAPYGYPFYREECGKGAYKVTNGVNSARMYSTEGSVDPLEYLNNQRVFIWIPNKDEWVSPGVRSEVRTFYERVGVRRENLMAKYQNAYHVMPTGNHSEPRCEDSQLYSPTFGENGVGTAYCGYNGAFEGLNYILGGGLKRPDYRKGFYRLEPLRLFHQAPFLNPEHKEFLDEIGFYYVPSSCRHRSCRLHVFLHGCYGSRSRVQWKFISRSGYLEVAELNSIIILFPQSIPFEGNDPGCWDVFGATGGDYANKNGVQMGALGKMLEVVTGKSFFTINQVGRKGIRRPPLLNPF